ncbi:GAP family protein [Microbacterium sp. KUDC0406]|uniref:GAP family protein n=1 Tax=Microbacterium sp. KUDC0406 TaxID=2909588 RepID=UPI001F482723|nr:GAP family protein [Microbacterium sp. KUDC0406]UJP11075.1 GAP family protein [Microbacterium sp. KUDC0406]
MITVIWQLLPIALGVMVSPISVMALLGILVSTHARRNGTAFAIGWVLATGGSLLLWTLLLGWLGVGDGYGYGGGLTGVVLHALIGLLCIGASVWTYRRSHGILVRMGAARTPDELTAATPQLPGLLRDVDHYSMLHSFALGITVFVFNPVNMSLLIATALSLLDADISHQSAIGIAMGFVVAAALPVIAPVLVLWLRGADAPFVGRMRTWVMNNNGYISAGLLMLIGFLQLTRALEGIVS